MYIENMFVLLAAPLVACLLCVRGRSRAIVASLLAGMSACLLSAYVSSFAAQVTGINAVQAAIQVAPAVEETLKLLPLLFFFLAVECTIELVCDAIPGDTNSHVSFSKNRPTHTRNVSCIDLLLS